MVNMIMLIIQTIFLLISFAFVNSNAPEVEIQQGLLRGQYLATAKGKIFSSFTGVPYPEPPIGLLRVEVPQPARNWDGILRATRLHPVCQQTNIYVEDISATGDEDCLYLNVYTPQAICFDGMYLPVVIFFHGGAFFTGESNRDSYDPSILLDKDYRLGPLEFLSTGDEIVPGNNGLKDHNLAIKWFKGNIAYFGGDPERITLFGQSAGGTSAHFHMLSPMSKALVPISTEVFGSQDGPKLIIEQGYLRGKYEESRRGRLFSAFTGIPYAKAPVGELRFKAPVLAEPWKGILDASKPHAICPQSEGNSSVIGSEDCLFLNVYTPQLPHRSNHLLPVLFYIHGGYFLSGSAMWDGPNILLDKDIVLVAANFRLGALGFLSTGDDVVPGNNGLKDQNLALKWVKNNIAAFGGDPEKITVTGQSSGGVCAHHHMLSPLSRDLIKGVIAQSGTAMEYWGVSRNDEHKRNSKKLAEFLNCPTTSSEAMIQCLKNVDAADIVNQEVKYLKWATDPMRPYKPVIESKSEGAFLSEHPADIIKSGKSANIPFLTGVTTEEGGLKVSAYYRNSCWIEDIDQEFNRVVPISLEYDNQANKNNISKELREFYFGDKKIDYTTRGELTDMYTDIVYLMGADEAARMHAKYSNHSVYYYLFGYRGSESFCRSSYNYGVCHADDLFYLFTLEEEFPNFKPSKSDEKVMDLLTTLWANFASTGNPTPQTDSIITTEWEPVKSDDMEYYFIKNADDIKMSKGLYSDRIDFLRKLDMYSTETVESINL